MPLLKPDTEQRIVKEIHRDSNAAMDVLYKEYAPYLSGLCSRYISDDDAMEDVLQEAFIKIFTSMGGFHYRGKGSLKAWVSRIAVNECLQYIRKNRNSPVPLDEDKADDIPEDDPDVNGLSYESLVRLIRQLPEGYREVFNLFAIDGKSHKEIGELLHIKPDSSASQFHRAKNMLAQMISKMKAYEG